MNRKTAPDRETVIKASLAGVIFAASIAVVWYNSSGPVPGQAAPERVAEVPQPDATAPSQRAARTQRNPGNGVTRIIPSDATEPVGN